MKKILTIFLLVFCLNLSFCFAVEDKKINLKEAMDIAQKNNLDIRSYKIDVDIAKNEIEISNRLQNPALQTNWNFGKAGKGNPNQIGLSETIELFKRAPRKKLAKTNYKLTAEEYEYQKFNLKMDVAEAYIKLIVAKSILKKYEHQQAFLEELLKISNLNNKEQDLMDLDTIEAKIALNQIITEVNKAKTNAKTAKIEFNRIINTADANYDSADTELSKENEIEGIEIPPATSELPKLSEIENVALNNRFDVKIAKNQIELAKRKLSVVTSQRIPDVEISSGYGYQTVGLSDDNTFKSGAYLAAGLVNIPLFYSYRPEIKNARLEIEKAETNYISTVNKAKKNIEIAYENFITAQLNLTSYNDKILKDSENLFELFEKKYKVENVDFATLAAVEESYQDLVVGYSETLSDYYVNWINLLREINSENLILNKSNL